MKKLYGALLAVVLAAAMVLPVMAAPSPRAEAIASRENAAVLATGAQVNVLAADVYTEVKNVVSNSVNLANLGVDTAAKLGAAFDLKMEIPQGQSSVTVSIKVSNAKAGDYAVVLHRRSADGAWEKVGEGSLGEDLIVTATFSSFSPVAVMIVDSAQVSAAGVRAPKTGQ